MWISIQFPHYHLKRLLFPDDSLTTCGETATVFSPQPFQRPSPCSEPGALMAFHQGRRHDLGICTGFPSGSRGKSPRCPPSPHLLSQRLWLRARSPAEACAGRSQALCGASGLAAWFHGAARARRDQARRSLECGRAPPWQAGPPWRAGPDLQPPAHDHCVRKHLWCVTVENRLNVLETTRQPAGRAALYKRTWLSAIVPWAVAVGIYAPQQVFPCL